MKYNLKELKKKAQKPTPKVLIIIAAVVIGAALLLVLRGRGNEAFRELALSERPFTTLTPRSDGHWLKLAISNFKVEGAKTLEYELIYEVPGGTTQGVPGKVEIGKEDKVERDLLLGSESAGKFRYDEDVTDGDLNLKFRSAGGKLVAQLSTHWKLLKDTAEIKLADGKFAYMLETPSKTEYLLAMSTFGLPKALDKATGIPYGIFASGGEPYPGTLTLGKKNMRFDGASWSDLVDNKSPNIGTFVEVSE